MTNITKLETRTIAPQSIDRSDEQFPKSELSQPAECFGDIESLLNSREWLEAALSGNGATVTGGAMGCGCATVDIELEGHVFAVSMHPI